MTKTSDLRSEGVTGSPIPQPETSTVVPVILTTPPPNTTELQYEISNDFNQFLQPSHTRTRSQPLPFDNYESLNCFGGDLTNNIGAKGSSCSLTDLDFVNIPPPTFRIGPPDDDDDDDDDNNNNSLQKNVPSPGGRSGGTPGEIPASVMLKYCTNSPRESSTANEILQEILVDLGGLQSSTEITAVLENFNAILEKMDREDGAGHSLLTSLTPSPSSSTPGSSSRIKNSVEAFAELLLSGGAEEDEDLLIIMDDNESESQGHLTIQMGGQEEDDLDDLEALDLCPSLGVSEVAGDLEGYESDRPMVSRASMRKLRPVKLKPIPKASRSPGGGGQTLDLEREDDLHVGLATTLNSPKTNTIIITSLVNSVLGGVSGGSARGMDPPQSTSSSQYLNNNNNNNNSSPIPTNSNTDPPINNISNPPHFNSPILQSVVNLDNVVYGPNIDTSSANQSTSETTIPSVAPSPVVSPAGPSPSTSTSSTTTNATDNAPAPAAPTPPTAAPPSSGGVAGLRGRRAVVPGMMPVGRWPHRLSSVLALIGCTLGLNNICRFALLSVQYGANFILQFLFLSFAFGIPLLTFHMSIGQYLSSGIIDMWKISPIFQGIGVGLLISQAMIGLYTAVGVSWMFIYFRDSFVTRHDQYRWGKCLQCEPYAGGEEYGYNQTVELAQTVPDYFNGVVLQRSNAEYPNSSYVPSSLKFTVAFNLAVVWMLVFVSLSKGLKSYGKVVHGFVLAPVAALFVLAFKMVGLVENGATLFGQTAWSEFFFNSQTWVVAAREAFFTWGLLGACVMQVTAHNRHSHSLKSDAVIVVMVTTVVLLLSAFIGNTCLSVVTAIRAQQPYQYSYVPSSFESAATYKFMSSKGPEIPDLMSYNYNHNPFLMGVRILKPDSKGDKAVSGYQVLRLATELFPATMAILSPSGISPFWTVLFYFTLVLFGIAQQLAIWHCVIKGVIAISAKTLRSWETTITFFVCGLGFCLGLPLCTESGIFVEYFLDFAIGSGWWIMILYLLELVAVFIVRGAPYCGENIVTVLITGPGRLAFFLAPLVSFIWNVIMPVALLVLAIASFKSGNIRELYDWNPHRGYAFWPSWTREVGSLIQLLPILAVPFVAIIQSCRYLSTGPADLFDRMQELYRPSGRFGAASTHSGASEGSRTASVSGRSEDPPPKYTPPPSYSTATGAKIARFLRNSIRRSMRRLSSPGGPSTSATSTESLPPPPNYASVILEINAQMSTLSSGDLGQEVGMNLPPPQYDEATQSYSKQSDLFVVGGSSKGGVYPYHNLSQTLGRSLDGSKERASLRRIASDLTPRDIARMLRASFRRQAEPLPTSVTRADVESQESSAKKSSEGSSFRLGEYLQQPAGSSSTFLVPPYTFSRNSLEKIDSDLAYQLEPKTLSPSVYFNNERSNPSQPGASTSSSSGSRLEDPVPSSLFGGYRYDRSRNRFSNDSQLALISDGCYGYDLSRPCSSSRDFEVDLGEGPGQVGGCGLLTLAIVSEASGSSSLPSLSSHSQA